jgi:hypothetical protein
LLVSEIPLARRSDLFFLALRQPFDALLDQ